VTGGGLVLLSGRAEEIRKEFFGPVGSFGILVALGLLAYELFDIKKCHALIETGKVLEQEMGLPVGEKGKPAGQFIQRPNNLLRVVNEPFAAALIYPAVLAAWTYLALLYANPSSTADRHAPNASASTSLSGNSRWSCCMMVSCATRRSSGPGGKRRRTQRTGHKQASEQPSQAVPE
jgi:hypothetical protein